MRTDGGTTPVVRIIRAQACDTGTRTLRLRYMYERDIFDHDGALTAAFLLERGYCCGNGCRNCPYLPRHGGEMSRPSHITAEEPPREPEDRGLRIRGSNTAPTK